jgi:hypothetical protein
MPREDKLGGIGRRIVCHKKAQKAQKKTEPMIRSLYMLLVLFCGLWSETNAGEDVCELPL